jgi:hypothetical protein
MPKYRVLEKSFIDNHIREAGDVVEYDGYPSENLEPLCDEGRAKQEEGFKLREQQLRDLVEQAKQPGFFVVGAREPKTPPPPAPDGQGVV